MTNATERNFEDKPAERIATNILVGLTGASGGGKTYSALRLATGIVEVTGGEIFFVDTDNRRALHYADRFKFRHVEFAPPFSSDAYVDALDHCERKGAGCIIVDSMSHEHEGIGGVLEQHELELDRLAGDDQRKRERENMRAWGKPKAGRRRLILRMQRLQTPAIFCFRAREGVKLVKKNGRTEVVPQGFRPIAGDELVFEMTLNGLLYPNAGGVPTWESEEMGERLAIKLPEQFRVLRERPAVIDEELGRNLAKWARGAPGAQAPKKQPPAAESRETSERPRDPEKPAERQESRPAGGSKAERAEPSGFLLAKAREAGEEAAIRGEPREPPPGYHPSEERVFLEAYDAASVSDQSAGGELPLKQAQAPAAEGGFADFAAALADAKDWMAIREAVRDLTATQAWKDADRTQHSRARALAYNRLREVEPRFDFLTDPHAFRCYVEAESDVDAIVGNFNAFKRLAVWAGLNEAARTTFEEGVKARLAVLAAARSEGGEFA